MQSFGGAFGLRAAARGGAAALLSGLIGLHCAALASAGSAPLTAELQRQVRAATFEVVIRKPVKDSVTYEKPLPLELIPFVERNDAYWPLGSAFAIGPNTFVTAAHVLIGGVGSQFGVPGIRDSEGQVYAVDRVLKFALHEDFVVFTVSAPPAITAFATSTTYAVDDPVFAVGNALGEGVVIRDGLLTSLTPEAQDGKWKWLRFSAAASPGNSGGPLLDAAGRVIGMVAAKSPNENLNYALPIEQVLRGSDHLAVFDTRESFGIPKLLQGTIVAEFKDSFALPLPFPEFARRFRAAFLKYFKEQQARLLAAESADLFPHDSAKLLATLYQSFDPSLVAQEDDRSWDARSCGGTEVRLAGEGRVWHCADTAAATLFRLQYPGTGSEEQHYHDSKEFMDLLLKGVKTPRMIGPQAVRITSLGPALQETLLHDHYGRVWQLRTWSLGYVDAYVVVAALPTPDGYAGLMSATPSALADTVTEVLKFLTDYVYLTYTGSLPQWRAFLDRRELRPAVFEHLQLQYDLAKGLRLESPRLQLDTAGLLPLGAQSMLDLQMAYMMDHGTLIWDVGGIVLSQDRERKTWLGAYRQAQPADDAGKEARERWEHMSRRDGDFTGIAQHDDQYKTFWIRTVAAPEKPGSAGANPAVQPLYELVYNTDNQLLPRRMEDIRGTLAKSFRIME
jgi:serine protease Do